MITALLNNWRIIVLAALIAVIGFLGYQWKSTEAQMVVKVSELNTRITTLEGTISHNEDEIKKLKGINEDLNRAADIADTAKEVNRKAGTTVKAKTQKNKDTASSLGKKIDHTIPPEKLLSSESVSVLQELIDKMEPQITDEGEPNA